MPLIMLTFCLYPILKGLWGNGAGLTIAKLTLLPGKNQQTKELVKQLAF